MLLFSELNSFSFLDGICTGYSLWIQADNPDSPFIVQTSEADNSTMQLYFADSQLTTYIENEGM